MDEITSAHVECGRKWKAGDPPPEGSMDWHQWAGVQERAGIRQSQCRKCGLWCYPQELTNCGCMHCKKGGSDMEEITMERVVAFGEWVKRITVRQDYRETAAALIAAWEREQERIAHPLVEMKDGALCCCNCGRRIEEAKGEEDSESVQA